MRWHDGAERVRRGIDEAPEMTDRDIWPDPDMRLVDDDRPPAAVDNDMLPDGWATWIAAEAEARGCPRDYVAVGLIVAASAWIGNARHVAANATWSEPPHLWTALIGPPSAGKSPALRPIVETCRAIEREAEPAWQAAMDEHAVLAAGAEAINRQWRERVAEATKTGDLPPDRPPGAEAPPEPARPRSVAMDATTEELQHLMSRQPRGLLYLRNELNGWLGMHDRYGGHGTDRAFYLECWDGGAYVADRVKHRGQPIRIAQTALALLGGMQPDKLREALAGADDGLSSRLAYVWPEPVPIVPLTIEPDAAAIARRDQLMEAARRLSGLGLDDNPAGEPKPRVLRLAPDALALFEELRREAMERARTSRGLAAGWHGKSPGRVLRLALVFELLGWAALRDRSAEPPSITADAMVRAGGYLDYLAAMLDRVTAGLAVGQAEADAAVIARHILVTRPARLNERDLYQRPGWSWLRDGERRGAAVRLLANAAWIRQPSHVGGGRPRGDWQVSPRLWEASR